MSFWFLDASVLLAREDAENEQHGAACELLAGEATMATLDLAYYEVANVAIRAWNDSQAARRLQGLVSAIADDGGLVQVDETLIANATGIAEAEGISAYDAGYVAGAASLGAKLVSCDLRDLVEPGLALTPSQACKEGSSSGQP